MYGVKTSWTRCSLAALALLSGLMVAAAAHGSPEGEVVAARGAFFAEAGGDDGGGYAVLDQDGVLFWTEFVRLGGVAAVGYPISRHFEREGFRAQAFQMALLRGDAAAATIELLPWDPAGEVSLENAAAAAAAGLVPEVAAAPLPPPVTVTIRDFTFGPASVEVAVGQLMQWQNVDTDLEGHTATGTGQLFDTGHLEPDGGHAALIFGDAGTYTYTCSYHPTMRGTVTVVGE